MDFRAPRRGAKARARPDNGRVRARRVKAQIVKKRAGYAGYIASFVIAAFGVALGASFSYLGGTGEIAYARGEPVMASLRDGGLDATGSTLDQRAQIVNFILSGGAPERLPAPAPIIFSGGPRIIIIFDDMGLDRTAFEAVMRLPGPLTLSFLPYGKNMQPMVDRARKRGDAVLLHLPMEPAGAQDPGPHALRGDMPAITLLSELDWNLSQIKGYIGVNNHMGSKFTRNEAAMKTVLSIIDERGLFFLDSVTTGKSMARAAGGAIGVHVYARDVFLDPEAGKETVIAQLEQVERIAVETGFAVAICHPHPDTLAVIGPWLTSAPSRGFRLDTVASLGALEKAWSAPTKVALRE